MNKRPSFQFYPNDYLNDPQLQLCSMPAQGLWVYMMCLMHHCEPYGHLIFKQLNHRVETKLKRSRNEVDSKLIRSRVEVETLSHLCRLQIRHTKLYLNELENHGVFSRNEEGVIFSRRMVKDEETRMKRALGGYKSIEHPNTHKPKSMNGRVPFEGTIKDTFEGTLEGDHEGSPPCIPPSSSSSSSSSKKKNISKKKNFELCSFPQDFGYDESHKLLAIKLKLDVDFKFEEFKDWALAKDVKFKDWRAAFRNFLRRSIAFQKKNGTEVKPRNEPKSNVPWFNPDHAGGKKETLGNDELKELIQKGFKHH